MRKVAYLYNDYCELPIAKFVLDTFDNAPHSITGQIYVYTEWSYYNSDSNTVKVPWHELHEKTFKDATGYLSDGYTYYAKAYIKSDGCSHFYFTGEDSENCDDIDGYYHICGHSSYAVHLITLAFAYEVAKEQIPSFKDEPNNNDSAAYKKFTNKIYDILDGCKVLYSEFEEED